jgi:hypothetical protein
MTNKNTNRQQIITLLEKAQTKVQIAVSWLTDELIIAKLIEIAPKKKVELLLSCDALNVWRYSSIKELQEKGAYVRKTGSNAPGNGMFMHAKFMIVDGVIAYGGSFNYTEGASSNYENFDKLDSAVVPFRISEFQKWWATSKDYTVDFENPEMVLKIVKQSFLDNQSYQERLLKTYDAEQRKHLSLQLDERGLIAKAEMEKDQKRETAIALQTAQASISKRGEVAKNANGVIPKEHKFYGGSIRTEFGGNKPANAFMYAMLQKKELEQKFSFLKCRIENDTLVCRGLFKTEGTKKYDIRIEFRANAFPQVYILNHKIEPLADIHIYREGALCLFYPGDLKWKNTTSIAEYTIPWIFEWILFYEIYLLTGVWEAEYVPHGNLQPIMEKKKEDSIN